MSTTFRLAPEHVPAFERTRSNLLASIAKHPVGCVFCNAPDRHHSATFEGSPTRRLAGPTPDEGPDGRRLRTRPEHWSAWEARLQAAHVAQLREGLADVESALESVGASLLPDRATAARDEDEGDWFTPGVWQR